MFSKENTLNSEEWPNLEKSSECYGPSFSSSNTMPLVCTLLTSACNVAATPGPRRDFYRQCSQVLWFRSTHKGRNGVGERNSRQGTEICNFGEVSPLNLFEISPVTSLFSRFAVHFSKEVAPKCGENCHVSGCHVVWSRNLLQKVGRGQRSGQRQSEVRGRFAFPGTQSRLMQSIWQGGEVGKACNAMQM